jgi:hypothetical protein
MTNQFHQETDRIRHLSKNQQDRCAIPTTKPVYGAAAVHNRINGNRFRFVVPPVDCH